MSTPGSTGPDASALDTLAALLQEPYPLHQRHEHRAAALISGLHKGGWSLVPTHGSGWSIVPTDAEVRIVFDGLPGGDSCRFVEVEDAEGQGRDTVHGWTQAADGHAHLTITPADLT